MEMRIKRIPLCRLGRDGTPPPERAMVDRVSTGIDGLDAMLRGGFIPSRPYVISGPRGSGKTILASHFVVDGLKRGEACLLVALDEPPSEVKANIAVFGWNVDKLKILDATPDVRAHKKTRSVIDVGTTLDVRDMEAVGDIRQSSQVRAMEVTVHSVQKMIKQEAASLYDAKKQRYQRVVIDSLSALKRFAMRGEDSRIMVQSFMRFLSELEATTLLISEKLDPRALETEFFLCRGEIKLLKWLDGNITRRAVAIEKFRGSAFDESIRPMTIGNSGIVIDPMNIVSMKGGLQGGLGEAFLERRVMDEVSSVIESVLHALQEAHRNRIPVREVDAALSRAMFAFHRRTYDAALKFAMEARALLEEKMRTPPPPPPAAKPGAPSPAVVQVTKK